MQPGVFERAPGASFRPHPRMDIKIRGGNSRKNWIIAPATRKNPGYAIAEDQADSTITDNNRLKEYMAMGLENYGRQQLKYVEWRQTQDQTVDTTTGVDILQKSTFSLQTSNLMGRFFLQFFNKKDRYEVIKDNIAA